MSQYIDLYKDAIKAAVTIKQSLTEKGEQDTYERQNIYLLSFMGFLRSGYPFSIRNEEETINNESQTDDAPQNDDNPVYIMKNEKIISINIDDDIYECSYNKLKDMFRDDFLNIVNPQAKEVKLDDEIHKDIIIPEVNFEEDTVKEQEVKEKKVEETVELKYLDTDSTYPDDEPNEKRYDSFMYNQHSVSFIENGQTYEYMLYVYPLSMDSTTCISTQIAVGLTTKDGSRTRAAISSDKAEESSAVKIEINGHNFLIRGLWKENVFLSKVQLLNEDNKQNLKIENTQIKATYRTSTYYQKIKMDNNVINICPMGLIKNNPDNGIAPAFAFLETGTNRMVLLQNSIGQFSTIINNRQKNIITYWVSNNLKTDIENSETHNVFS